MCPHKSLSEEYKDLFIGPQEFVVAYSKAPEQPQSSARPICHSHAMTRTAVNQPPYALPHRSSPRYALSHGRRLAICSHKADCIFWGFIFDLVFRKLWMSMFIMTSNVC